MNVTQSQEMCIILHIILQNVLISQWLITLYFILNARNLLTQYCANPVNTDYAGMISILVNSQKNLLNNV